MEKYTCYLSLGANLGRRLETVCRAVELLENTEKIQVRCVSSMYETPPWGKLDQPAFINCAVAVETGLEPFELLHSCQEIEKILGRVRHEHWGARTIDVDMLYIPGISVDTAELKLPHPYMMERAFVLVPLAEIAPELLLENGLTAVQCRDRLADRDSIVKRGVFAWRKKEMMPSSE